MTFRTGTQVKDILMISHVFAFMKSSEEGSEAKAKGASTISLPATYYIRSKARRLGADKLNISSCTHAHHQETFLIDSSHTDDGSQASPWRK